MLRRSFSHGPRWKATAAYETSTVRKMRATPWQSVDGNARDRCVFWLVHSLFTDYVRIAHISVFSHYFKRLDRFTKLATSSYKAKPMLDTCGTVMPCILGQ